MDCRVPNCPRTPGLKRRKSEKPVAAAWQEAHEMDPSTDKAVSRNKRRPKLIRSSINGLSRGSAGMGKVAAHDEGFAVNEKKTRVLRPSSSQRVTGIVVNGEQPRIPRATVRRLRAILHQAEKTGLETQNRDGHPDFANHVAGMLAWVRMVSPQQAEPLVAAWRRARRSETA